MEDKKVAHQKDVLAYDVFRREQEENLKDDQMRLHKEEIEKVLAKEWKDMSNDRKKQYLEKVAEEEYQRYEASKNI